MECTVSSQSKGEGGGVTRWRTETNEQRNTVEPRGADDLGNERMSTLSLHLPFLILMMRRRRWVGTAPSSRLLLALDDGGGCWLGPKNSLGTP